MLVYRIENSTGQGVFTGTGVDAYVAKVNSDTNNNVPGVDQTYPYSHPSPCKDEGIGEEFANGYHNCAFKDTEQLLLWFPYAPGRKAMMGRPNCSLVVYETDDYICGSRQVVFVKSKAKKVGILDLVTFEPLT